jgi:fermentation-respiration switch protein FrsA (DUF1100 family)
MNRWLRRLAWGFACVLILGAIVSWNIAQALIAPAPSKVTWPAGRPYLHEEAAFSATDGIHLKGWFLPQKHSTSALVLLQGVRSDRRGMLPRAFWLHDLGYNVLVYDARGCGESDPTLLSFGGWETRDLLGAFHWLETRGMTRVGCIGTSQGAATILLASGQLPSSVRAVVAESSYATLRDAVDARFLGSTGLPSAYLGIFVVPMAEWKLGLRIDDVSPLREISKLKPPVYILGGTLDHLAPPGGTHQLYDAAICEKKLWMVEGAGHLDFLAYLPYEYKQRIGDFLSRYLSP